MAHHTFYKGQSCNKPDTVTLYVKITIGDTGAPTLVTPNICVSTITRTSEGLYSLTLAETYDALLDWNCSCDDATIVACPLLTEAVSTTGVITFNTNEAKDDVLDAANGSVLRIAITLQNSAAPGL